MGVELARLMVVVVRGCTDEGLGWGKADREGAWLIHSFSTVSDLLPSKQTHDGKRRAGNHRPTPITIPPSSNEQQHAAGSVKAKHQ